MEKHFDQYLAKQCPNVSMKSALAVLELTAEGGTVPFIARYRKEKTGNLDEVQIRSVIEVHETFQEIIKRKAFLLKEIGDQGNLTEEIKKRIELSFDLGELEEIYRPFKKKKKTRATVAREAGLEPLANWIWDLGQGLVQDVMTDMMTSVVTLEVKAKGFINAAKDIVTYDSALKGAQDILVEKIANEADLRLVVREHFFKHGKVVSKKSKEFKAHSKYEMYGEFEESVTSLLETRNSHRYMAMRRGWQEGELVVDITGDEADLLKKYSAFATKLPATQAGEFLAQCAKLALSVYVIPSVANEVHRALKDKADLDSITVFAENVKRLMLASPFGPKIVLGVDPGVKTGCKVALIDKGGNFLSYTVVQIMGGEAEAKAKSLLAPVLEKISIQAIAVGNGTAGRQAEAFFRKIVKDLGYDIPVVMVNESGASVYSASEIARQEFPDLDVTVKGAISIARRLQDPLAELVKVEPKSIGVGQYQHDVNQSHLKKSLDGVVESCVNVVGVDLNTASTALLSYVSGIGPALAQNIVEHRGAKGLFQSREDLQKVGRFSSKVYEQCAGFLRIPNGKMVLDSTGVHPERYQAVRDMAHELGVGIHDLVGEGAKKLLDIRTKWAQLIGEYTFNDIVKELEKPGRDPRDAFKVFSFRDDIFEVKDLKADMICPGIVTNVTNFGAFVDIGVHQDGLVHISELAHKFVEDPRKVVNPGDQVKVKVLAVDHDKKQISLTMKLEAAPRMERPYREFSHEAKRDGNPVAKREFKGETKPEAARNNRDNRAHASSDNRNNDSRNNDNRHSDSRRQGQGQKTFPKGGKEPFPQGRSQGHSQGGHSQNKSGGLPPPQHRPKNPFNNPFAALMDINSNKK